MVLFVIALGVAAISWLWNPQHNATAVALVKWISTFGALILFVLHVVWVPFCRHEEQKEAIEDLKHGFELEKQGLEAEVNRLGDQQTRLTIEWGPTPPCSQGPRCRLKVRNTNELYAAENVRVELVGIDPVPRSLHNPAFPVNLPPLDETMRTINPNSDGYFDLFALTMNAETVRRQAVIRDENGTEQRFDVDDPVERAVRGSYTLAVRASCARGPVVEARFEARFPAPPRGQEAFHLEPVRPG